MSQQKHSSPHYKILKTFHPFSMAEVAPNTSTRVHIEDDEEEEEEEVPNTNDLNCTSHTCGSQRESGREGRGRRGSIFLGGTLDPKSKWIQEWNRAFLLVCATGLAIDPLFFYALSISDTCMCLFVDGWFAITVTVLRCMTDAVHLCNMWLQLKMVDSVDRTHAVHEKGCKQSHTRVRCSAVHYLRSKKGFFFDVFVILPVPQVTLLSMSPF